MGPVEPGAGQQAHGAAIEARMHAVAVELDFVEPLIAFRRRVDKLGELRPDPLRPERPSRRPAGALPAAPCREGIAAPEHATLYARVSCGGPRSP
jgi:hypothetical protein